MKYKESDLGVAKYDDSGKLIGVYEKSSPEVKEWRQQQGGAARRATNTSSSTKKKTTTTTKKKTTTTKTTESDFIGPMPQKKIEPTSPGMQFWQPYSPLTQELGIPQGMRLLQQLQPQPQTQTQQPQARPQTQPQAQQPAGPQPQPQPQPAGPQPKFDWVNSRQPLPGEELLSPLARPTEQFKAIYGKIQPPSQEEVRLKARQEKSAERGRAEVGRVMLRKGENGLPDTNFNEQRFHDTSDIVIEMERLKMNPDEYFRMVDELGIDGANAWYRKNKNPYGMERYDKYTEHVNEAEEKSPRELYKAIGEVAETNKGKNVRQYHEWAKRTSFENSDGERTRITLDVGNLSGEKLDKYYETLYNDGLNAATDYAMKVSGYVASPPYINEQEIQDEYTKLYQTNGDKAVDEYLKTVKVTRNNINAIQKEADRIFHEAGSKVADEYLDSVNEWYNREYNNSYQDAFDRYINDSITHTDFKSDEFALKQKTKSTAGKDQQFYKNKLNTINDYEYAMANDPVRERKIRAGENESNNDKSTMGVFLPNGEYVNTRLENAAEYERMLPEMSQTEIDTYHYLRGTSADDAKEYLRALQVKKQINKTANLKQSAYEFGQKHKWLSAAANVAASTVGGAASLPMYAAQYVNEKTGGKYIPGEVLTGNNPLLTAKNAMHQGALDSMDSGVGKFAYNAGLSIINNVAGIALYNKYYPLVMSMNAAGEETHQGLERGLSKGAALFNGTLAGSIEYLTEKMFFDDIMEAATKPLTKNATSKIRNLARASLAGAGSEFGEEAAGALAQNITDTIVAGDKSHFNEIVNKNIAEGMNKDDATRDAFLQLYVLDPLQSGLAGAISGAALGGGYHYNNMSQYGAEVINSNISDAILTRAMSAPEGSNTKKIAVQITDALKAGKKVDTYSYGNMYAAMKEDGVKLTGDDMTPTDKVNNVYLKKGGGVAGTVAASRLSWAQYQYLDEIGKAKGKNIIIKDFIGNDIEVDDGNGGKTKVHLTDADNGYYNAKTGDIYISANSENPLLATARHEIFHPYARTKAGQEYIDKINNIAKKQNKEAYEAKINGIKRMYENRGSRDIGELAREEFAADAAWKMMSRFTDVVKLTKETPSIAQKIKGVVVDLLNTIEGANAKINGVAGSVYDGMTKTQLQNIRRNFEMALGEDVAVGDANTATTISNVNMPQGIGTDVTSSEMETVQPLTNPLANPLTNPTNTTRANGTPDITQVLSKGASGNTISNQTERNITDVLNNGKTTPYNGTIQNSKGKTVAAVDGLGDFKYSHKTFMEGGRDALVKYLNEQVNAIDPEEALSETDARAVIEAIDRIYEICEEYINSGKYVDFSNWSKAEVKLDDNGSPVFSVVRSNNEYPLNIDMSLVCAKRRALDAIFNRMVQKGIINSEGFNFTPEDFAVINQVIKAHGFEIACDMCYVEAKRYRQINVANDFANMYNKLVRETVPKGTPIKYFNFGADETVNNPAEGIDTLSEDKLNLKNLQKLASETKKDKNGVDRPVQKVPNKIARYLLQTDENGNHPNLKLLQRGDFMSTRGFEGVAVNAPELLKIYNSKKGTGGPKASFGDMQYINDIIENNKFTKEKAFDLGGVRIQSFSDYMPRLVFDYCQMVAELAAKELPAHAYTKVVLFVKQFGLTGIKINMSAIPKMGDSGIPGLNADGTYAWADESFPFNEAVIIQNAPGYRDNCGIIAVGVCDEHIWKMMADERIRVIIPYHKSGINPAVASVLHIDKYTNYEKSQRTARKKGVLYKEGVFENVPNYNALLREINPETGKLYTPTEASKKYFDYCIDNNITPKFTQFAFLSNGEFNPNYYKVLNDFTTEVGGEVKPQQSVKPIFPNEISPFGSMKDLIQQGLEESKVSEGSISNTKKIDETVDDIITALEKSRDARVETQKKKNAKTNKKLSAKENAGVGEVNLPETDKAYMDADIQRSFDLQDEINQLYNKVQKMQESDEYLKAMDDFLETLDADAYNKYLEESGYNEAETRLNEARKELDEIRKKVSEQQKQKAIEDERKAIEKSGLSEADYFRKLAVKEFGYTPYFVGAAYILPNGKMLNFSGEKGKHYGMRGYDHRAIETIYANTRRAAAMVRFMGEGNIRIMPEGPGIDISSESEPTKEQYATIRKFIREYSDERRFAVDITDNEGYSIGDYFYEGKVSADRVINDIKYYFEHGEVREQSDVAGFLYSTKENPTEAKVNLPGEDGANIASDEEEDNKKTSAVYKNSIMGKDTYKSIQSEAEARKPEFMYDGITNKETYNSAQRKIKNTGEDKATTDLLAKAASGDAWTADDTAAGLALMAHYQTNGDPARAVDIASAMRQKLTQAGQAIQAMAIIDKLTPEGKFIAVSREATKANSEAEERLKKKAKQSDKEEYEGLTKQLKKIKSELRRLESKRTELAGFESETDEDAGPNIVDALNGKAKPRKKVPSTEQQAEEQEELEAKLKQAESDLENAYEEYDIPESDKDAVDEQLKDIRKEISEIKAKTKKDLQSAASKEQKIKESEEEREQLLDDYMTAEELKNQLSDELSGIRKEISEIKAKTKTKLKQAEGAEQRIQQAETKLKQVQAEYDKAKAEADKFKAEIKAKADEIAAVKKEIDRVKRNAQASLRRLQRNIASIERSRITIEEIGREKQKLQLENEIQKIYDRYNVPHMSEDRLAQMQSTFQDIENLNSADDLIELIINQSIERNTVRSKTLRKALKKQNIQLLKDVAVKQLFGMVQDLIPSSNARMWSTYQTISHLLNLQTQSRNITSNVVFNKVETVANNISVLFDAALAWAQGKGRTIGFDRGAFEKGHFKASADKATKKYIDIALDVNTEADISGYMQQRGRTFKGNRKRSAVLRWAERTMSYGLGVTDEFSKGGIEHNIYESLKRLNNTGLTDEEIREFAREEARYRTFQDENIISEVFGKIKKALNTIGTEEFGLGDFVIKYTQVPGALLMRSLEFSPAGYIKMFKTMAEVAVDKNMTLKQQRDMSLAFGRATTGTGLIWAFSMLAKMAILINEDEEEDKEVKNLNKAEGLSGTQINLSAITRLLKGGDTARQYGDVLVTLGFLEPLSSLMTKGIALAKDDNLSPKDWLKAMTAATFEEIASMSTMQSLRDLMGASQYGSTNVYDMALTLAASWLTGFIPAPIRQTAKLLDKVQRDPYHANNELAELGGRVLSAIPGASKLVPAKVTPWGDEKTNKTSKNILDVLNAYVNPGYVNIYQGSDISSEIKELYKYNDGVMPKTPSKSMTVDGTKYEIKGKDYEAWSKMLGKNTENAVKDYMDTEEYAAMNMQEKADKIADIVNEVYADSKEQYIAEVVGVVKDKNDYEKVKEDIDKYNKASSVNGIPNRTYITYENANGKFTYELDDQMAEKYNTVLNERKNDLMKQAIEAGAIEDVPELARMGSEKVDTTMPFYSNTKAGQKAIKSKIDKVAKEAVQEELKNEIRSNSNAVYTINPETETAVEGGDYSRNKWDRRTDFDALADMDMDIVPEEGSIEAVKEEVKDYETATKFSGSPAKKYVKYGDVQYEMSKETRAEYESAIEETKEQVLDVIINQDKPLNQIKMFEKATYYETQPNGKEKRKQYTQSYSQYPESVKNKIRKRVAEAVTNEINKEYENIIKSTATATYAIDPNINQAIEGGDFSQNQWVRTERNILDVIHR